MTTVTRRGKTSLHQLRKMWRTQEADSTPGIPEVTAEDRERIAREDANIAARRAAYPLH